MIAKASCFHATPPTPPPPLPQKCTSVWVFWGFLYLPFLPFRVCLLFLTRIMNKKTNRGGFFKVNYSGELFFEVLLFPWPKIIETIRMPKCKKRPQNYRSNDNPPPPPFPPGVALAPHQLPGRPPPPPYFAPPPPPPPALFLTWSGPGN